MVLNRDAKVSSVCVYIYISSSHTPNVSRNNNKNLNKVHKLVNYNNSTGTDKEKASILVKLTVFLKWSIVLN